MSLYQRLKCSRNKKQSVNERYQCEQKCERLLDHLRNLIYYKGSKRLLKNLPKSVPSISPTGFYAKFYASDGAVRLWEERPNRCGYADV